MANAENCFQNGGQAIAPDLVDSGDMLNFSKWAWWCKIMDRNCGVLKVEANTKNCTATWTKSLCHCENLGTTRWTRRNHRTKSWQNRRSPVQRREHREGSRIKQKIFILLNKRIVQVTMKTSAVSLFENPIYTLKMSSVLCKAARVQTCMLQNDAPILRITVVLPRDSLRELLKLVSFFACT